MQKILFICLAAYNAPNVGGYDPKSLQRQEVYAVSLNRLLSLATASTELIVVENTVSAITELSESLQAQLKHPMIKDVLFVNNNELGVKNKGAGEYVMCQAVAAKHREYIGSFDWVVYFTSRHIISFPLVFEYAEKFRDKQAIVSGATYLYADNRTIQPAGNQFDDVIFAMKPEIFLAYVKSMDPERLTAERMNSEANLYNYLHDQSVDFQKIGHWGLLRYNYASHKSEII
jgi:hypothetical protein